MPSLVLGFNSGGTNILSGNYFSGTGAYHPVGGIQIRAGRAQSGSVYVALSGGVTVGSGVFFLSGFTGRMDGMELGPGDSYFIPKLAFIGNSGSPQVFAQPDAACSGVAKLYWEVF